MLSRIILYDVHGDPMGDLDPSGVISVVRTEEINGEHSLDIATVTIMSIGMRLLMQDTTGKWREYVIDEADEEHKSGAKAMGTYHAMWSLQYDLSATPGGTKWAASVEGTNEPVSASVALSKALEDSVMWRPGTCDVATVTGASLYDGSCWDYLSTLVSEWKGEIDAEITVDLMGVVTRKVAFLAHLGESVAKRRFDWGYDLASISRKPDPGPYYCRVVPRGGGEGTDSDGVKYSDRCGIESETGGVPYLQDNDAALLFRTKMPDGTWFYPTKVVTYQLDTKDDAEELYNKALEDLHNHTRPNVAYEADVVQLALAGLDTHGISLGDAIQCVDNGFGNTPLQVEGRVVGMTVNEYDPTDVKISIGQVQRTLADEFMSLETTIGTVSSRLTRVESGGSSDYLRNLIARMNSELNSSGGWTYVVPNEGIVVYDIEVDDPLIGYNSELDMYASSVVQIKGGGIRIANTRKSQFSGLNDWDWKSVFVSGHVAAELVTAVQVTAGFIGDATNGNYWDLDNGVFHMDGQVMIGDKSLEDTVEDIAADAGAAAVSDANGREQTIYRSAASASAGMAKNTAWVTDWNGGQGEWTAKRPSYSRDYPILWTATQRQTVAQMDGSTCTCTTPVIDETTTVIDGSHITTGSIDASTVDVFNLSADNITTGTLDAEEIDVIHLDADNITTGTLGADRIGANVISSGKLAGEVNADIAKGVAAYSRRGAYSGVCATLTSDAAKAVTCNGFELATGAVILVRNSTTQTNTGALTLNVNQTGAKQIYVGGNATSSTNQLLWASGSTITYVYDGSHWVMADSPGTWVASTCGTGAATAEKAVTAREVVLCKGATVMAKMSYVNTASEPTINVSSLGARNVYWGDSDTRPVNGQTWLAGMRVGFTFDGAVWRMGYQTVIDGGSIVTGTLDAAKVNVVHVNANNITTGIIQDRTGRNKWNMDTGEFTLTGDASEVGGRQYLDGSADFSNWSKLIFTTSGNTATCPKRNTINANTLYNAHIGSPSRALPYKDLRGYHVTVSFEAYTNEDWGSSVSMNYMYVRLVLRDYVGSQIAYIDNKIPRLERAWTRYKFSLKLSDNAWTRNPVYSSMKLENCYLEVMIFNCSTKMVQVRKVKLERGETATDWCRSENDYMAYSSSAAKAEAKKINVSLDQDKVVDALTNGGKIKSITRVGTELYINATYISSGTLKGDIVRTGLISDSVGKSSWNLTTGKFITKDAEVSGTYTSETDKGSTFQWWQPTKKGVVTSGVNGKYRKIEITNARVAGMFRGDKSPAWTGILDTDKWRTVGKIDFSSLMTLRNSELATKNKLDGKPAGVNGYRIPSMTLSSESAMLINAPFLMVNTSEGSASSGTLTYSGDIKIKGLTYKKSGKQYTGNVTLRFIHGMLVSVSGTDQCLSKTGKKVTYRNIEFTYR